jgi:hypothetical protein
MPNWCANNVIFQHPEDPAQLKAVVKAWNDGALMQSFFPCPEDLINTVSGSVGGSDTEQRAHNARKIYNERTYGHEDWYGWRTAEWGTKWDVGRDADAKKIRLKKEATSVNLNFDSAWSPPIEFYAKMHNLRGFDITAYYFEPGVGFCGMWRDGISTEFDLSDAHTKDDIKNIIPQKIIETFDLLRFVDAMELE